VRYQVSRAIKEKIDEQIDRTLKITLVEMNVKRKISIRTIMTNFSLALNSAATTTCSCLKSKYKTKALPSLLSPLDPSLCPS
jgi:hypothetical protein